MNKIDKIRIYINDNYKCGKVINDDIEIGGQIYAFGGRYDAITSKSLTFFPFPLTKDVMNYYKLTNLYQRKKKLKRLNRINKFGI